MKEREPNDFYATHPSAIPPLLEVLDWRKPQKIWENSCGTGCLSKPLINAGHFVTSTDLIDRGFGTGGIDFLEPSWLDHEQWDAVIMNPPYKHAQEFVEKSLTLAPVVCAFLRLAFLESSGRKVFFDTTPLETVAVFRKRIPYSKEGKFDDFKSHPVAYAWFIWRRGCQSSPIIRWI